MGKVQARQPDGFTKSSHLPASAMAMDFVVSAMDLQARQSRMIERTLKGTLSVVFTDGFLLPFSYHPIFSSSRQSVAAFVR